MYVSDGYLCKSSCSHVRRKVAFTQLMFGHSTHLTARRRWRAEHIHLSNSICDIRHSIRIIVNCPMAQWNMYLRCVRVHAIDCQSHYIRISNTLFHLHIGHCHRLNNAASIEHWMSNNITRCDCKRNQPTQSRYSWCPFRVVCDRDINLSLMTLWLVWAHVLFKFTVNFRLRQLDVSDQTVNTNFSPKCHKSSSGRPPIQLINLCDCLFGHFWYSHCIRTIDYVAAVATHAPKNYNQFMIEQIRIHPGMHSAQPST